MNQTSRRTKRESENDSGISGGASGQAKKEVKKRKSGYARKNDKPNTNVEEEKDIQTMAYPLQK